MASIRRRGNVWQARVSRKGVPAEVGTFETKGAAERWARTIESEMDRGVHVSRQEAERATLAEVIGRYIEEVSPLHKGHDTEVIRLRALQRSRLAEYSMSTLSPKVVAEHRDKRLGEVSKSTVTRELAILSAIINHARREPDGPSVGRGLRTLSKYRDASSLRRSRLQPRCSTHTELRLRPASDWLMGEIGRSSFLASRWFEYAALYIMPKLPRPPEERMKHVC